MFCVLMTGALGLGCEDDPVGLDDVNVSLQVSPWSLDFGEQALLQSAQASLVVVNDGDVEIDVDRLSIEGDVESFLVNRGSLSLAPSEQETLVVTFTPNEEGATSATLHLHHDGILDDRTSISLQGEGVVLCAQETTVYPDADRDGYGDVDGVPSLACTVEAGFSEANTDCDDDADAVNPAAREVCDNGIDDDCDDDVDGDDSDCETGEPEPLPTDLDLTISPPQLTFGARTIGVGHDAPLTVINPNAGEAQITDILVTGADAALFAVSPTSLALPGSGNAVLNVTFTPMTTQAATAELLLLHAGVGSGSTTVSMSGSGIDDCMQERVTAYVDGDGDGHGDADDVGQLMCGIPEGYSAVNDDCDDDDELSAPDLAEDCDDDANNDCDEHVADIDDPDCAAPGTSNLTVSPSTLNFGMRAQNQTHDGVLTVLNPNALPVDVTAVQITGTDAARFAVAPMSLSLTATGNAQLTVSFTPIAEGAVSAELLLLHAGVGTGATTVPLLGSGESTCPQGLSTVYVDSDGDGRGDINAMGVSSCGVPMGFSTTNDDCDDNDVNSAPHLAEDCDDAANNDCDAYVADVDDPDCAPRSCTQQDDCGLNQEGLTCPRLTFSNDVCRQVCRGDDECGDGLACRALPGSASLGFCDDGGGVALGGACTVATDCAQGMCDEGFCRALCQSQDDCTGGDICGRSTYNTLEFGGNDRDYFTTVCRPLNGELDEGGVCSHPTDIGLFFPENCASHHCDAYPWAWGYTANAGCAPLCAGSWDCNANQVCGIVFNGLGIAEPFDHTQEGAGNYIDGMVGCYMPVDLLGNWRSPGVRGMGNTCTSREECRSFLCGQAGAVANRCTDFCDSDSDCDGPNTPGWRCRYMQLNHTSYYLQGVGMADEGRFSIVGACSP